MKRLDRSTLRRVIETLFRSRGIDEFKQGFLADHFSEVFFLYGGENNVKNLTTALFTRHFIDDESEILDALIKYCGRSAVEKAIKGSSPDDAAAGITGGKLAGWDKLGLVRDRSEALQSMRNAHALVIGISAYEHIGKLGNTLNDAKDVAATLMDPAMCGYPKEQVQLLLDGDATKARIESELEALAQRTDAGSTAFIFFACHGGRITSESGKEHFLLPVNSGSRKVVGEQEFLKTAISEAQFSKLLASIPARKLVVALDCCYSGGVATLRGDEEAAATSAALTQLFNSGRGRAILAATNREETAKELVSDRNGLFTKYLLEGLRGAGGGKGAFVDVFEVYRYVHHAVSQTRLISSQTPSFKADMDDPDFYVAVRSVQYMNKQP